MLFADLMALATSEKVFAGLFIISLFVVGRWVKNFIAEQARENNDREKYILQFHEKQLNTLREDKARNEARFETLMSQQEEAFSQRVSILIQEYREVLRDQKEDNKERERELMSYLDKTSKQLEEVSQTLKQVQSSLEKIEHRMEEGFEEVWQEIKQSNKEKER